MKNKRKPMSEETKNKLREKALQKKSQGLGDTIEKITEATGIKSVVEAFSKLTGIDCGCDDRKERLNALFPYKKLNCLSEADYDYLDNFFKDNVILLDIKVQRELIRIYESVFSITLANSNCSDCWRGRVADLRKVYEETKVDADVRS